MRYITVYASRIAALAGLHPYVPKDQALLDQWYSSDRVRCADAISKLSPVSIEDVTLSEEEAIAFDRFHAQAMAVTDPQAFTQVINAAPVGAVRDAVRSEASKDRGARDEGDALDAVAQRLGSPITERNTVMYSKTLDSPAGIRIIGRVDGWRRAADEVVEVKNRMTRFFDVIPTYEKVQAQTYMWLSGAKTLRFVQCLHGDIRDEVLDFDPTFLTHKVWPALEIAVQDLRRLLDGDEEFIRECLADGTLPDKFLKDRQRT